MNAESESNDPKICLAYNRKKYASGSVGMERAVVDI
jgi:hypothetical protein